jgi:KamA family protein
MRHHTRSREGKKFQVYLRQHLDEIPQTRALPKAMLEEMKAVAAVLPFRVNNYVVEELIDWSKVPDDPIFQLTFPQAGMLEDEDLQRMLALVRDDAPRAEVLAAAHAIQSKLNPHPAGQMDLNVPKVEGDPLAGMQHKYRETVLFFPSQGQTCHAYCTYCFRWAQFVGMDELKFASREGEALAQYVQSRPEVRSVLFTGGDPMVMRTELVRRYVEPLLRVEHLNSIRFGTKAPAYWPYRFTTDRDAHDLLSLFEEVRKAGKNLALMAHYSHPIELEHPDAQQALRAIVGSGAVVRCQAPLIRHVNDDADAWARMWTLQVALGAVPYYMFVERDTGAKRYFEVPLARAHEIYSDALTQVSGLERTVRGPSMSALPGKVMVEGTTELGGQKVFVLKFLQGRDPRWTNRLFFAKYDEKAAWLDDLRPAFEERFFYEEGLERIARTAHDAGWADLPVPRTKLPHPMPLGTPLGSDRARSTASPR